MITSQTMTFPFGNIHYTTTQTDKDKTLLCLPAFHSSTEAYQLVQETFKDQYNIICVDFPGHGLSDHLKKEDENIYSIQGFTAVLKSFIERLGLTNYVILGNSIGGNCAVRSMKILDGLLGIVLLGSVQAHTVEGLFACHHQSAAFDLLFQKQRTKQQETIVAEAYTNPTLMDGAAYKIMLKDIQRTDPNARPALAHNLETQPWVDELALLQESSVPLCIVLGDDDRFINAAYYEKQLIQSGIDKHTIHRIEQARHVPQLESIETIAVIQSFLNTL